MTDAAVIQSEFDRLAAVEALATFSHTDVYLPRLLGQLPARVSDLAEVGCGSGTFTELLAPVAGRILAIDLSPAMLRLARVRCAGSTHIDFREADANEWKPEPQSLDAIVSVATLHHLEPAVVLPRWVAALRPGGVILILDILARPGLSQLPANVLAAASGTWLRWRRTGRLRDDPRVREAWEAHARFDRLASLGEVHDLARAYLPGARVTHHVLWRYSIRYAAPGVLGRT